MIVREFKSKLDTLPEECLDYELCVSEEINSLIKESNTISLEKDSDRMFTDEIPAVLVRITKNKIIITG